MSDWVGARYEMVGFVNFDGVWLLLLRFKVRVLLESDSTCLAIAVFQGSTGLILLLELR